MTIEEQWRWENYKQGYREGRMEAKLEIAQRMLDKKYDIETVLECTCLAQRDLQRLTF